MATDNIQHGLDNDTNNDPQKGAALGGAGGAAVGAAAGAAMGPVGAVIGAVVGGVAGAVGSGAAVAGVHSVTNENTVSGLGHGVTPRASAPVPNGVPGVQTGGQAVDGTPDTRGITEKVADTVTGNQVDDKTGKPVV